MADRGLAIASGIAEGINNAVQNYQNTALNLLKINMAKTKMKQEEDIFGLEKKQKELEIKKGEYIMSPEQLELERNKLKAETAAQTALFNLRNIQVATEETKQKKELENLQAGMTMVQKFLSGEIQLPEGAVAKLGQYAITGKRPKKTGTDLSFLINEPAKEETSNTDDLDKFLNQF